MNTSENTLSFGLLADVHHAREAVGNRLSALALEKARGALEDFARRGLPLVIFLGDAIGSGADAREEEEFLAEVRALFDTYPGQVRCVLGNHDAESITKARAAAALGMPAHYYAFDAGPARFIMLDGNHTPGGAPAEAGGGAWDEAALGQTQLQWLERELAQAENRPVIICCHQCLDDARDEQGNRDPHVLLDAPAARQIIQKSANVRAVLQGHRHPGNLAYDGGIPYLTLAAVVVEDTPAHAIATLNSAGELVIEGFGRQGSFWL